MITIDNRDKRVSFHFHINFAGDDEAKTNGILTVAPYLYTLYPRSLPLPLPFALLSSVSCELPRLLVSCNFLHPNRNCKYWEILDT
jgi:hypothetical protein